MFYQEQLLANKNNLRKTWQILNDALNNPKSKQKISKLLVNNTLIDDPSEIANKFNTFLLRLPVKFPLKLTHALRIMISLYLIANL
jgi:hypothetical protein